MSWADAVVYQVYPRSFQDSNGDGVGDLNGIRRRLDHLVELGVDAFWLSPVYPSPLGDFGYDVSDYTDIDPVFGTLADFDALVEAAHERGLRLLMDLVPCHTSIRHPWFREHPDWYVWADEPPNNWLSSFGGPAWSYHEERGAYYLHSFYPEQPDLDWRNPEVVEAFQAVLRFWRGRGVDGFRLDAIDRLLKDPDLRDDPEPTGIPDVEDLQGFALRRSRNASDIGSALAAIREAVGDALLVAEAHVPSAYWKPYLEHFDVVFAFELLHAPWESGALSRAIAACMEASGAAWVLSNHDFGWLAGRYGERRARAAVALLLTLPGPAFLYQGDEIGAVNGPGGGPRTFDRAGRDGYRHPMQWDGSTGGGFTEAEPWLPPVDPARRNVAAQRADEGSHLALVRRLIGLRGELGGDFRLIDAAEGVLAFVRGPYGVAVNTAVEPRRLPGDWEVLIETQPGAVRDGLLAPDAAVVGRG